MIQEMGPDDITRQGLESRRIVIVAPQEGQVYYSILTTITYTNSTLLVLISLLARCCPMLKAHLLIVHYL
jgi:hypothetical protein